MKTLLIIAHTPSDNTQALAETLHQAADTYGGHPVKQYSPFDVDADILTQAAGVIFFTPENFGYMSGALKDMFDRTYYSVLENLQGMPYLLIIRAGNDGTGCQRAVTNILQGLRWHKAQDDVILKGEFQAEFHSTAEQAAGAFAAKLSLAS